MPPPLTTLRQRSELLAKVRRFFWERDFLEVETPLLADEVIPELHIEPMGVGADQKWLQASPELHMKRLVAAGMQAIFQVTRSFRGHERGPRHLPEFTLVEWYRQGDDLQAGMDLLDQFCQTVAGAPPAIRTRYAAAFEKHVGLCPHSATVAQLAQAAVELGLTIPDGMPVTDGNANHRDEWFNLLLACKIEPQLGRHGPEMLYGYPTSQAALAKIIAPAGQPALAQRFELYWQGVELANGYDELTDPVELRDRLVAVNQQRCAAGRTALPLPESLLQAMEAGLPACAGCALGWDRLVMLVLGRSTVAEVNAFPADQGSDRST